MGFLQSIIPDSRVFTFENIPTYDADINVGAPYKPLITRYISIFCEAARDRIEKERSFFTVVD